MPGVVGAGGLKPPATRLKTHIKFLKCCFWGQKGVFKHEKRPFLRVKYLIIAVLAWSDKNLSDMPHLARDIMSFGSDQSIDFSIWLFLTPKSLK
jgi:hypothetical protein